jgi:hypothetical protein
MKASLDTDITIHLYSSGKQGLMFTFFDKLYMHIVLHPIFISVINSVIIIVIKALKLLRAYRCVIISILVYINYYYSIRLF